MTKSIACALLVICVACSSSIEIETDNNFEALLLPDGSQVYLNHHSTISYDQNFNPRTIYLDGDAFFTVVPSESTFTVTTAYGDVEVLGTEFNVQTTTN